MRTGIESGRSQGKNNKREHLGETGTKIFQQRDCRSLFTCLKKDYNCPSVAGSLCDYCLLHP